MSDRCTQPIQRKLMMSKLHIIILCLLVYTSSFAQTDDTDWPVFRGSYDLAGRSGNELPASPSLKWSVSTGVRTKSSPVLDGGTIFFGNDKGTLTAVTLGGVIKWRFESGSTIEAPPLVYKGKVIFGAVDGILRAVNATSGKLIWTYRTGNQIMGSANVWTYGRHTGILAGSYDYFLHCVDPETGKLLWKVESDNYINGAPGYSKNRIVFGGCDGIIRVIDPVAGKEKDTINIGVYMAASPSISSDIAYFGDYDGTVYSVNLATGRIIWKTIAGPEPGSIMSIPAISPGRVITGSENKYVYCFSADRGGILWRYRTNGRVTGSAVVTPSKVLFGSTDGNIYILNLGDGRKIWNFDTGAPVSSSPVVTSDGFYILSEDGRLLAFGDKKKV